MIALLLPLRINLDGGVTPSSFPGCAHAEATAPTASQAFNSPTARQEFGSTDGASQAFSRTASASQSFALVGSAVATMERC